MKYLLDTHTVIWLAVNPSALSKIADHAIFDSGGESFVSIVSAWEVAIKIGTGKLHFVGGVSEFFNIIDENGFGLIPITKKHIETLETLPHIHKDLFDRLLVSTALVEKLTIISADENVRMYDVPSIW
jgi:PIN domain nuclease of toxin-antitoxin system